MDSSPVFYLDRIGTRELVRVVEPGCTRLNEESAYGVWGAAFPSHSPLSTEAGKPESEIITSVFAEQ